MHSTNYFIFIFGRQFEKYLGLFEKYVRENLKKKTICYNIVNHRHNINLLCSVWQILNCNHHINFSQTAEIK
jgi:hypothetical protein